MLQCGSVKPFHQSPPTSFQLHATPPPPNGEHVAAPPWRKFFRQLLFLFSLSLFFKPFYLYYHYHCCMTCAIILTRGCCAGIKRGLHSRGVGSPRGHRWQPALPSNLPKERRAMGKRWVSKHGKSTAQSCSGCRRLCGTEPSFKVRRQVSRPRCRCHGYRLFTAVAQVLRSHGLCGLMSWKKYKLRDDLILRAHLPSAYSHWQQMGCCQNFPSIVETSDPTPCFDRLDTREQKPHFELRLDEVELAGWIPLKTREWHFECRV